MEFLMILIRIFPQAKEFVEGAPNVVKSGITKEEAEELVEKLKAVGAVCEIE